MSREIPAIQWRAVLVGATVALAVALLLLLTGGSAAGRVASAAGIAAGALVAGRLAPASGAFQGGLVAALWVGAEALADPFLPQAPGVLADTGLTVLFDALEIGLGVGFGWLGGRAR